MTHYSDDNFPRWLLGMGAMLAFFAAVYGLVCAGRWLLGQFHLSLF